MKNLLRPLVSGNGKGFHFLFESVHSATIDKINSVGIRVENSRYYCYYFSPVRTLIHSSSDVTVTISRGAGFSEREGHVLLNAFCDSFQGVARRPASAQMTSKS